MRNWIEKSGRGRGTTRLRTVAAAALLATLIAAGTARAEGVGDAQGCTWNTKTVPLFMGGEASTVSGASTSTEGSTVFLPLATYRYTNWKIVMRPGYMYGDAEAWEDMAYDAFMTGSSSVSQGAARGVVYNVCQISLCGAPAHEVTARAYVNFSLLAETDAPASASVYGLTNVVGTNTGVQATGAGAAAAGDGGSSTVTVKATIKGGSVDVPIQLSFGSELQTKAVAAIDVKKAKVPDEEYTFQHQIQLDVEADSNMSNWFSRGHARLHGHRLHVETELLCTNCGKRDHASVLITPPPGQ